MSQEQLGSLYPFLMMLVVFAFFYFFAVRPQKKREKQINAMRDALRTGDRVVTIGGIRGKIVKLGDEYLTIETGSKKTQIEVTKWAIGTAEEAGNRTVTETVEEEAAADHEEELLQEDSVTEDRGI